MEIKRMPEQEDQVSRNLEATHYGINASPKGSVQA